MKNYILASIEKIDNKFIYLNSENKGEYFLHLECEKLKDLNFANLHKFYIGVFNNEFESLEVVFLSIEYRNLFNELIKIKTVGIKTTFFILNNFTYNEIYEIVKECEIDKISAIKGIGVYTARLIVDHLQKEWFDNKLSDKKDKVLISLVKLGFNQKDILKAIHKIDNKVSIEEMTQIAIGVING